MTRFLSGANETASQLPDVGGLIVFAELDFASGFVRVHTGVGSYTFQSNTYSGIGQFGTIEVIKESTALRPQPVRLVLSGVDNSLMTTATTDDFHGRAATIYVGFLDEDQTLIADPELLWEGRMDTMSISLGESTGAISLQCENRLARWDTPNMARYSDEDLQSRFAGDRFFDQLHNMMDLTLQWGGRAVLPGGGGRGRDGPFDEIVP